MLNIIGYVSKDRVWGLKSENLFKLRVCPGLKAEPVQCSMIYNIHVHGVSKSSKCCSKLDKRDNHCMMGSTRLIELLLLFVCLASLIWVSFKRYCAWGKEILRENMSDTTRVGQTIVTRVSFEAVVLEFFFTFTPLCKCFVAIHLGHFVVRLPLFLSFFKHSMLLTEPHTHFSAESP